MVGALATSGHLGGFSRAIFLLAKVLVLYSTCEKIRASFQYFLAQTRP